MEDGVRNFAGFGLRTLDCGLKTQPCLHVLLEVFLCFEVVGDDDNRPLRKNLPEQSRNERLGRLADTGTSQHSAMLHAPGQGLHRGSWQDVSEQIACRRRCRVLRQQREVAAKRNRQAGDAGKITTGGQPNSGRNGPGGIYPPGLKNDGEAERS